MQWLPQIAEALLWGFIVQAVLDSYPNRDAYTGNSSAESWSTDSRFGSVVGCSKSSMSYVTLDPVPYASGGGGAFAVGIWFKIPPGGLAGGSGFQYIYSHGSQGSSGSVMQADQVSSGNKHKLAAP